MKNYFLFLGCLALASQKSFVDTAPASETDRENSEVKTDDSVKELENLKNKLGRTISMLKTQTGLYSSLDGREEVHSIEREEVKNNGKTVAKLLKQMDTDPQAPDKGGQPPTRIRADLEIPSEGIHKSVVQQIPSDYLEFTDNGQRKSSESELLQDSQNTVEKNTMSGSPQQYTPLEMAEYVFWTGDEKSVSQAIEQFLQEEMMTREEAIIFLQEIKYNLDYLKSHYNRFGLDSREQHATNVKRKQRDDFRKPELQHGKTVGEQIRSELNQLRQLQEAYKKKNAERESTSMYFTESNQGKTSESDPKNKDDGEYEDLLERLRLADFLYTEYSLEEVIYQLAKVMFTQSLSGGNAEAQQAFSKFMNFLENEAEQGRISRALQKKVLDVLIASLSDTLNEHPELLNMRQGAGLTNEKSQDQNFLRRMLVPEEKTFIEKDSSSQRNPFIRSQIKDQKIGHSLSYGLGK